MNVHLKPISFRKYSLIVLYSLLTMAMLAWGMELYFERLYGDLTRIGNFPEHSFGWQSEQPAVLPENFKDYSLAEADGLKVDTMTWQELKTDEALRTDLGNALRAAGFKGRYVIIESVERLFQGRMKALSNSREPIVKHDLIVNSAFPMFPLVKRARVSFDKLNGADWGVKALYNSIKLALNLPEKYLKSGAVQAISFNGCALFSHRLCNYALFVTGDFQKETFNSIDNVLAINKNLQASGFQPIWLIVPDKATVYLGYGEHNKYPYQNMWQNFAQHPELITPDLGTVFSEKSRSIKDFYMPNDTHLSTNGFLYLGEVMTQGMRNLQANQPAPFSH
ncbi:MAG: hypothetical protein EXR80_08930 [Methylococcales bacterium]|nr:hypothetical protein [Methylococcales bacterium]